MEIGLVYSKHDPRQAEVREFVHRYVDEHGILAHFVEREQPVRKMKLTIDGQLFVDSRDMPPKGTRRTVLSRTDIAHALEQCTWCL